MEHPKKPNGWNELLQLVCSNTEGVTIDNIFQKTRKTEIVLARRMFCNLVTRSIGRHLSQKEIIEHLGPQWNDRSILSYYEKCHKNQYKVDKRYQATFKKLLHESKQIAVYYTRTAA